MKRAAATTIRPVSTIARPRHGTEAAEPTAPASTPVAADAVVFRTRADEVYAQLKRDVAEFILVPGDRFTENEISDRLGVSRTPVRQALFRLQQEGMKQS